jgi:hypothetical protein
VGLSSQSISGTGNLANPLVRFVLATILVLGVLALDPAPARSAETGSFTLVQSMRQYRKLHTATLLSNGTVLVAGGAPLDAAAVSEIYDPLTATWTNSGRLNTGREFHTATLLPNGKVLVAGGAGPPADPGAVPFDPVLASAEIFDPTTGTWTLTGSMGQPRQVHTATLLPTGKVLVAGGLSYFDSVFPTGAELYDPATGKWSPTLPLVSGRRDHIAALLPSGKVLLIGGFNTSDTGPSNELYDPESAVATPVQLAQPTQRQSGAFEFTFRTTPGLSFTVLSATNLATGLDGWTSRESASEVSPGHYQFTDATPASPQRFYLVRSP